MFRPLLATVVYLAAVHIAVGNHQAPQNTRVNIRAGHYFALDLTDSPSYGSRWEVLTKPSCVQVRIIDSPPSVATRHMPLVGSPSTRRYIFQTGGQCWGTITLRNDVAWDVSKYYHYHLTAQ